MHLATVHRIALPSGKRLGGKAVGWAILRYLATAILVIASLLLLTVSAVSAQSVGPVREPVEEFVPDYAQVESAQTENQTVTSTPTDLIHVVEVGDTLTNIAQRYNVEPANLAAYNQILDHNHVVIGQKLRIPPAGVTITAPAVVAGLPGADGYHVVRQGEALGAIAQRYSLTLEELMALNEIDNPNLVRMGTMLRLTDAVEPPSNVIQPEEVVITHTVKRGETLSEIAVAYQTTVEQIKHDNGLKTLELQAGQELRILPPATALEAFGVDAPVDGERKIVIDLSDQTLTAYQGDVVVLHTIVSTGKAETPTIPGEFAIFLKYKSQHMSGDDYDLPGVPWVMYYYDEYAIHGAYWHANFGIPTSHGCTNMTIPESKALYSWAPLGTRVVVVE